MDDIAFARRVFTWAGIYGLVALLPMYALEDFIGAQFPPPVGHPEFYYGFAGVALAWQVAFLVIGRDPVRFRPMMVPAVLEKLGYGVAVVFLVSAGRTPAPLLGTAVVDLVLAALFTVAHRQTRRQSAGFRL